MSCGVESIKLEKGRAKLKWSVTDSPLQVSPVIHSSLLANLLIFGQSVSVHTEFLQLIVHGPLLQDGVRAREREGGMEVRVKGLTERHL